MRTGDTGSRELRRWGEERIRTNNSVSGCSTRFCTSWESFNVKKSTGAVFLKVSKACIKVWHGGLIHKISHAHISSGLRRLWELFLKNRRFCVKIGYTRSYLKIVQSRVPQGSLLSPPIFSIYTIGLARTEATELALYADGTAVYTRSENSHLITRRL